MAGHSNLYLSFAESKLLHCLTILLVIESCEATRKRYPRNYWYSDAILLANAPFAGLAFYNLYRLFRPA
jgi:hypothetical protein